MILFPEKFNLKEMVQGQMQDKLVQYMKPENLIPGKGKVDKIKNELEQYLFQNMYEGEQKNEVAAAKTVSPAHQKLNTHDFEKVTVKKDISAKLKNIKQSEFLETYYSLFAIGESNMDPEKVGQKDKEDLKEMLFNINRRRAEIRRFTAMYLSPEATHAEKEAYAEQVRKNTKVIWHLKKRALQLMDLKGVTEQDLRQYLDGENLRNFDIDTSEIDVRPAHQNYVKKLKMNMQHSRSLLEIDQIEARAIQKRTACTTISELCDFMEELREKGESDKFFVILKTALITDKKTQLIQNNLKAIVQFEARLHFESYDTIFQIERKNLLKQTNKIDSEVDANSQELAISYLPFWDTKIFGQGKKQDEDTKKVKEWFQLTPSESFNLCKRINCNTFREFINYFRMNQRLYSLAEVRIAHADTRARQEGPRRAAHPAVHQARHLPLRPVARLPRRNLLHHLAQVPQNQTRPQQGRAE